MTIPDRGAGAGFAPSGGAQRGIGLANILVTGGAGFIGSHMVADLLDAGHAVTVIDNLTSGHRDAVLGGTFRQADVADAAALDAILGGGRIDAVIHFAASIEAGLSTREPLAFYRNNVGGTLALVEGMVRNGVSRVVFSSSAAVYAPDQPQPLSETGAIAPASPYGATKAASERLLSDAAAAHGLAVMTLRYFNAAGADPGGRLGERHRPETHLIPLALEAAAGRRPEFSLFGTDYPTRDGTCIRDFVHVSDLVAAHRFALLRLLDGDGGGVFNLGTGIGHSVREVVDVCRRVSGKDFPIREKERRPGDAPVLVAGGDKASAALGWSPRFSLDDMVTHAWRFLAAR